MSKRIPLSQGQFALVDDADYESLSKHNWFVSKKGYAFRNARRDDGRPTTIYMHREIAGASKRQMVDHINGIKADNRRSNLRIANHSQNMMNCRPIAFEGRTSRYKGVFWHRERRIWMAYIKIHGRSTYLGSFQREEDAAIAYDQAARDRFGEFARLNFPYQKGSA